MGKTVSRAVPHAPRAALGVLAMAAFSMALPAAAAPAAWPMFRGGPALNGIASGNLELPLTLLWTYKTGAAVRSSPAVAGGRVFIGSDDARVHAIDLIKGTRLWDFKTDGPIESSPLVHDGTVFIGSDDGAMRAFQADNGKLLWKFPTGDKIPGSPNFTRSADGKGVSILFGSFDSQLYCVDAATGRSNWTFETGTGIKGTPAVADGLTAVGGCDAMLHVIALKDGTKVKEIEIGAPMLGSVAMTTNRDLCRSRGWFPSRGRCTGTHFRNDPRRRGWSSSPRTRASGRRSRFP